MTRQLIVCDVETTGLDPARHHVLEVAAINVETGAEYYFAPRLPAGALAQAEPEALAINRYFERRIYKRIRSSKDHQSEWWNLWELLSGNTLGGSNPAFDAAMLNKGVADAGLDGLSDLSPWHHRLADLAAYAAPALGLAPNELVGLGDICSALGVENTAPHSALGDARATAECFRRLTQRYAGSGWRKGEPT
ncbi:3'-5' exonuclease [Mycobacterium kansasii]